MNLGVSTTGQEWSILKIILGKTFWDSYTFKNLHTVFIFFVLMTVWSTSFISDIPQAPTNLSYCPATSQGRNLWVILGVNWVYRLVGQFSSENEGHKLLTRLRTAGLLQIKAGQRCCVGLRQRLSVPCCGLWVTAARVSVTAAAPPPSVLVLLKPSHEERFDWGGHYSKG